MNETSYLSPEIEAKAVFDILQQRNITISTAESCTGGNIAHYITLISGSSEVFMGGIVSYSNDVKHRVLGVSESALATYGAVRLPVVEQREECACRLCGTGGWIAANGVAGHGGDDPDTQVGTVWIAARCHGTTESRLFHFSGNRSDIINQATACALSLLHSLILK